MQSEIISKWIVNYKGWNLFITADEQVYDCKTLVQLVRYWNNGVISWRIPRTSKRIGEPTLRKHAKLCRKVFQDYCPF